MKVQFAKMNPTENMTILVRSPLPRTLHRVVAERLMAYESVGGEQVGFIEPPSTPAARAHLQMMGGEFCGNASMSLAALMAYEEGAPEGKDMLYPLEVSGAAQTVWCRIRRNGDGFEGEVSMPLPMAIEDFALLPGLRVPLVRFEGIAHAIVPMDRLSQAEILREIPRWCESAGADAFGAMLLDAQQRAMRPLVYVRDTGSCVWERGCGSGTAAVGCWMAAQAGRDLEITLSQPGGAMDAIVQWAGDRPADVKIRGRVKLVAVGEAFVDMGEMDGAQFHV